MKGKIKIYFKENKKLFIGIIIGALLVGSIFYFYNRPQGQLPTIQEGLKGELEKTTWYERNKEIIDKVAPLLNEAETLHQQGKSSEAIAKYREVLDLVEFRTLFVKNKDDFNETYSYLSNEEKLDKISEFTYFGNSTAGAYYGLSFAYRDAKDAPNNIQNAINAAKRAVEEIDKVILLDEIEKDIDPNRLKFGEGLSQKRKASYLSILGDLYRLHGAYDLSIKTHKQAIELEPENADYYVWYGLALFLNDQYSLARQQWNKALQLDPNNADASKFLKQFSF